MTIVEVFPLAMHVERAGRVTDLEVEPNWKSASIEVRAKNAHLVTASVDAKTWDSDNWTSLGSVSVGHDLVGKTLNVNLNPDLELVRWSVRGAAGEVYLRFSLSDEETSNDE